MAARTFQAPCELLRRGCWQRIRRQVPRLRDGGHRFQYSHIRIDANARRSTRWMPLEAKALTTNVGLKRRDDLGAPPKLKPLASAAIEREHSAGAHLLH